MQCCSRGRVAQMQKTHFAAARVNSEAPLPVCFYNHYIINSMIIYNKSPVVTLEFDLLCLVPRESLKCQVEYFKIF